MSELFSTVPAKHSPQNTQYLPFSLATPRVNDRPLLKPPHLPLQPAYGLARPSIPSPGESPHHLLIQSHQAIVPECSEVVQKIRQSLFPQQRYGWQLAPNASVARIHTLMVMPRIALL